MDNVTLSSIKARYKELFPLNCSKDDLIKAMDFMKENYNKIMVVTSADINYKPIMVAYLLNYLAYKDKYPEVLLLNAHEISELYITGLQDKNLLRLSDINSDVFFLTSGYSEPNNKSLKDCLGFIINNYVLQDKNLFIYLKGTSVLNKDIENFAKSLDIPIVNFSLITKPKKQSKASKSSSNSSQISLF